MRLEIAALQAQSDNSTTAVRGAGVLGRDGYQDHSAASGMKGGPFDD
jgi:hypothetical protein